MHSAKKGRLAAVSAAAMLALMGASMATPAMAAVTTPAASSATGSTPAQGQQPTSTTISSTGLKPGQIKHVWLIILENKSYDATFSGLNQNSYLWKELPKQGALVQNYFGTGHYSQDNYTSMVSGQSASYDLQSDCDVANTPFSDNDHINTTHNGSAFGQTDNYGQATSLAGANASDGKNGCTYPREVPTLFNQFDAAGVSWKGYAQDLRNIPGREDGPAGAPGTLENSPYTNPKNMQPSAAEKAAGITSFTGATADGTDQYVAKHYPFPWFASITGQDGGALTTPVDGGTDADTAHHANLADQDNGLIADLNKPADEVPAFNWITPNNCSDAHDATCKGNNMSGLFDENGNPDYSLPLDTPAKNNTGGLYASDLFLRYYIPLIENSAAFKDGGLIDITFDEANPPFVNMSFNNATDQTDVAKAAASNELYQYKQQNVTDLADGYKDYAAHTFPQSSDMAKNYIVADQAGQNINGKNVTWEPTGPNSTLETDANGNQLYPGPGDNGYITRPPACDETGADGFNCVEGAKNTGYYASGAKTLKNLSVPAGASSITASVTVGDTGRAVTGTGIPDGTFVGTVTNEGPHAPSFDQGMNASFTLVDKNGNPVKTTAAVTEVTLSATGIPGHLNEGETPNVLFDAQDATPGGGRTGSVLISPLIKPGTVSTTYYNHYSWLRTMEDIFQVSNGTDNTPLAAGTVSGGLDGEGHLGFAAQAGLAPFGTDVFTNASTPTDQPTSEPTGTPTDQPTGNPTSKPTTGKGSAAVNPTGNLFEFYVSGRPSDGVKLVPFGKALDEGFAGDWNGDGTATAGVRRGNVFMLKNSHRGGQADVTFAYGRPGDQVLVGDWNGDGKDTIAVRRGNVVYAKNSLSGGQADVTFAYGKVSDKAIAGDFNGNGKDTVSVVRGNVIHVKNALAGGQADRQFAYGHSGDRFLAGDWNGDGKDTVSVVRGNVLHVNNGLKAGAADSRITFPHLGKAVFSGDFTRSRADTLGTHK